MAVFAFSLTAYATPTITINKGSAGLYQTCAGFGATAGHPAYTLYTAMNSTAQNNIMDFLYGTGTNAQNQSEIGLSMVRLAINPYAPNDPHNPGNWAQQETFEPSPGQWLFTLPGGDQNDKGQIWFGQQAQQRGVSRFYAVPWSPPPWMKFPPAGESVPSAIGGTIDSNYLSTFASYLETYQLHYGNSLTDETGGTNARPGIPIQWIGLQNEPNNTGVNWATCQYVSGTTAARAIPLGLNNLIDAVCPQFTADKMPAKVLAPEGGNSSATEGSVYFLNGMTSTEFSNFSIVSSHNYGAPSTYNNHVFDFPNTQNPKPVWMTEYSHGTADEPVTADDQIADALYWAKDVQTWLENVGGNTPDGACAYFTWFAVNDDITVNAPNGKGGCLVHFVTTPGSQSYTIALRAYALGQFSKFIRPGYQRIGSTSNNSALLQTAWVNPVAVNGVKKAVVVVINNGGTDLSTTVSGFTASSANINETRKLANGTFNKLEQVASGVTISGGALTHTFPANSITTIIESVALPTAAPATVTDLQANTFYLGSRNLGEPGRYVQLTWTAPGASGTVGMANKIDIRYSTTNGFSFANGTKVAAMPSGLAAGSAQSFLITGLQPNTPYYFRLQATSPTGVTSVVSNQATVTTLP